LPVRIIQGAIRKDQREFQLFPRLSIQSFYIEFYDSVFEFSRGGTLQLDKVVANTATLCYVNTLFDECEPPFTILGLFHTLIAWGKETSKERQQLLDIPSDMVDKYQMGNLESFQKSEERFTKALRTFGGLYHPLAKSRSILTW